LPVARYFIFVGGTLVALLFIADWCLPAPSARFADQLAIDRTIIRIRSEHKWPEKVVLDTRQPTIAPPALEEPPAGQPVLLSSDKARNQSNLEAMAQLKPDTQPTVVDHPTSQIKRGLVRTARSKRRITRRLARAETGGGCYRSGWIDNCQTTPRRGPSRDSL
jgi:hypothetical protein